MRSLGIRELIALGRVVAGGRLLRYDAGNSEFTTPRLNPYNWAHREITDSADMCSSSLDILERTCRVSLGERYPVAVVRLRAKLLLGAFS